MTPNSPKKIQDNPGYTTILLPPVKAPTNGEVAVLPPANSNRYDMI
jgi:hypothetical protein